MTEPFPPVGPFSAGGRCRCPRCGVGRLYRGILALNETCDACGLDFRAEDSADGPAFFVMFIIGPVIVVLAVWLELTAHPPIWVHGLLWPPLVTIGAIGLLRPFKATLIALQYRNRSGDGGQGQFGKSE